MTVKILFKVMLDIRSSPCFSFIIGNIELISIAYKRKAWVRKIFFSLSSE